MLSSCHHPFTINVSVSVSARPYNAHLCKRKDIRTSRHAKYQSFVPKLRCCLEMRAKLPGAPGVELAAFLVPFSIVQYMPNLFYGSLLCVPTFLPCSYTVTVWS